VSFAEFEAALVKKLEVEIGGGPVIPEPTAPLLFGTGLLVAGWALRRRTA
jgi:hypothetical protein